MTTNHARPGSPAELRVVVIGDELAAGQGDGRGLGWVGRVAARTRTEPPPFVSVLAVPGEDTSALGARWEAEADRRFAPSCDNRLVVALGTQDLVRGTSLARSRLNLANILDAATTKRIQCFVVGPPPHPDADPDKTEELSNAFADVCFRRKIPYVETFAPLRTHEQWLADFAEGGTHPGQAGYGLLAWLVLHHGWAKWIGSSEG